MKKIILVLSVMLMGLGGCAGYTQGWPYPDDVKSVCVEMFDSRSFRRGYEYDFTDALCKQIEVQTPYKIVSDRSQADTVLYGQIESIGETILATDSHSGYPIQREITVEIVFTWKNLINGKMYVNNKRVRAAGTYAQGQDVEYACDVAVNKAAQRVVETMQVEW